MFISHKYKVIFIHIQRTGGTSLEGIFDQCDPALVKRISISDSQKSGRHSFASAVKLGLEAEVFQTYTKFTVVRNPFSRLVSWYSMLKHKTVQDIGLAVSFSDLEAIVHRVSDIVNQHAGDFDEFVRLPAEGENGLFKRFYISQLDYISENGTILTDKILRFENLAQDFKAFAQEIGFEGDLLHRNKSVGGADYRSYYNEATKNLVYQRFKRDIDYFGYEF